jgi:hypothetical protein
MKNVLLIIIICISNSFCQKATFERILLFKKDVSIPVYPFKEKYDSLKDIQDKSLRDYSTKNPNSKIDRYVPYPYIYAETEENPELSFLEYSELVIDIVPEDYWVKVEYKIEWTGLISEASIIAYKGEKPDIDLIKTIVLRLRGKPAESGYGFPSPGPFGHSWVIKGRKARP